MIKSSACGNSNSCVYVGPTTAGDIAVAKDPETGPRLVFSPEEWGPFVEGVKAGEFDLDKLRPVDRIPGLVDEAN